MSVALLTSDLAVASRVQGPAQSAGAGVRMFADAEQAVQQCSGETPSLLIIDLSTPALDIAALMQRLRATGNAVPRTVAFGPHVHEERLAAARGAGCDEVLSRGEFFARLDSIVGGAVKR